jgi:DNA recombination protein RmuC
MAGMVEYCDFCEQLTLNGGDSRLRPDLMVKLPNQRNIVVDSKTPLSAYLDAVEALDDTSRAAGFRAHAAQVRTHLSQLAAKSYWAQFPNTPDFVVAFLPGEAFFSAALQHDPELIEYGIENRVLIATPTTLIGLLKAVAYGWRQESMAENAMEISRLGRELYERLGHLADHFAKVGLNLQRATEAYNSAVGTLETRVLVSARKMRDNGVSASVDLRSPSPVDVRARVIQSAELGPDRLPN